MKTPPFVTPFALVSLVLALGATNVVVNKTTNTSEGLKSSALHRLVRAPVKKMIKTAVIAVIAKSQAVKAIRMCKAVIRPAVLMRSQRLRPHQLKRPTILRIMVRLLVPALPAHRPIPPVRLLARRLITRLVPTLRLARRQPRLTPINKGIATVLSFLDMINHWLGYFNINAKLKNRIYIIIAFLGDLYLIYVTTRLLINHAWVRGCYTASP